MPYRNLHVRRRIIFCAVMILIAWIFQSFSNLTTVYGIVCGRCSVVIYIFLLLYWMRSLKRRILHRSLVRILYAVCILVICWLFLREAKTLLFFEETAMTHYLWYLYFVPQILIPLFGFYAATISGDREDSPFPLSLKLLGLPAACLVLLVLTNDWHHLIFGSAEEMFLPVNIMLSPEFKDWGWGYVLLLSWIISLLLGAIILLYSNCSLKGSKDKAIVPVIIFSLGMIMCGLRAMELRWFLEIPELYAITVVLTFEACIQIGLIPSNTGYDIFFTRSGIPSKMVDLAGNTIYVNQVGPAYDTLIQEGWRFQERSVNGGNIYWAEDISEINELKMHLAEVRDELSQEFQLLEAENSLEERRLRSQEKEKLYDTLSVFLKGYIPRVEELIAKAEEAEDSREYLARACLWTVYMKRRSNLMLFRGEETKNGYAELMNCLRESTTYLKLYGIPTSLNGVEVNDYSTDEAMEDFDGLAAILPKVMDELEYLTIYVDGKAERPYISLMMEGKLPVSELSEYDVQDEDGTFYLKYPLGRKKGGI